MAQQLDPHDYARIPSVSPPPGILPNWENPESRAVDAYVGISVCMAITLIFIILRLHVKLCVTHLWGWDDVACIVGWIVQICFGAVSFTLMGAGGGLGFHNWDVPISALTKTYLQGTLATLNLYAASAFLVKASLFLLYLRLFNPSRLTRWLVWWGIIICGLFYSASIIANCVISMPKPGQASDDATWLIRARDSSLQSRYLAIAQSVFGVISDIYLLVIPIRTIFKLNLPLQRKVGISAIFMIGIIAIACSLGSLIYRVQSLTEIDRTWFGVSVYIFSYAEISAGIVCSCLPILVALFRKDMPRKFQLPSLRYFPSSWFSSRSIRSSHRPYVLDKSPEADRLHSDRSLGKESRNDVEMENETRAGRLGNTIMVTRGVEVS